jgi:Protein of unknown function (DUF3618)
MATGNARTPDQIRREIESHREDLSRSLETLRGEIGRATDVAGKLRGNLPAVAVSALGAGFVLAGGIGATMRWFARRGREGDTLARLGRFDIIDRG